MRGYLAQRKKEARVRRLLFTVLLISLVASLLGFCSCQLGEWLNQYRFQIYLILLAVGISAFFNRLWVYCGLAVAGVALNFLTVSSAVDIWQATGNDGTEQLSFIYQQQPNNLQKALLAENGHKTDMIAVIDAQTEVVKDVLVENEYFISGKNNRTFFASAAPVKSAGQLNLPYNNTALFAVISGQERTLTVIAVDFSRLSFSQVPEALSRLENFVISCNNPVIVIGDFNMVAWDSRFSAFLHGSGLEVKNTLLSGWRNLLFPARFYVLGYRSLQVQNQEILPKGKNQYPPYRLELKF